MHKALRGTKYRRIPVSSNEEIEEIEEQKRPTMRKSKMNRKELHKALRGTKYCRIPVRSDEEKEDKQQEPPMEIEDSQEVPGDTEVLYHLGLPDCHQMMMD